jgi:hypothetical protein
MGSFYDKESIGMNSEVALGIGVECQLMVYVGTRHENLTNGVKDGIGLPRMNPWAVEYWVK